MEGILVIWGYDEDGFWKSRIPCKHDEIADILATKTYDDYDWEESTDMTT